MARKLLSSKLHGFVALGLVLFGLTQSACAYCHRANTQSFEGYYQSIDGLKERELKKALGSILKDHTVFNYGELWYHYEVTDVVPDTENQVFDYYSETVHYFTGTGAAPDGMNKEHACPQSWWGSGAQCSAYSDLFNVMPSEVSANSAKSNFPIGLVRSANYSNQRMKVGPSARSNYDGSVFEPCDEFKGDFARLYFYVATCYADAAWGSKESVAKTVAFKQEDYPTIQSWALDLLLLWNAQDPVSEWEITRNERVFSEQGNRNPFVDYPQLADYIWGDSVQYAFDLANAIVHGSGSGGGSNPGGGGDNPGGGGDNPGGGGDNPGGNEDDPSGEEETGSVLLNEPFTSVEQGNDYESSGSSAAWEGNDNFPDVVAAYQAGGAIKLGSGKKAGSLTSRTLNNSAGAKLLVELKVKGWTSVEGTLLVNLTGKPQQTIAYEATMNDPYQTFTLEFDNCPANAQLTIQTSAKRAFITSVRVSIAGEQALTQVCSDEVQSQPCYNLLGQPLAFGARGLQVRNGHLTIY